MKKHLDATTIMNELRGQSAFFPQGKEDTKQEKVNSPTSLPQQEIAKPAPEQYYDTMTPRNHNTVIPFKENDLLEEVRRAVKQIGKEAATQRLTLEEKQL